MASPALTSYSTAAGQPIHGGRWPGGRLVGNGLLATVIAAGTLISSPSDVSGAIDLGAVAPAGLLASDIGDARIVLWGQSNAMGVALRTGLSSSPLSSDAGLAAYDGAAFTRVYIQSADGLSYVPLENGTNQLSYTSGHFGPEFGVAVEWMRRTTTGILFIDKAHGDGQPISFFTAGGPTGFRTVQASRRAAGAAWLAANGYSSVTDLGLVWVQGESDYLASESTYRTSLNSLMSNVVTDGICTSTSKRVMTQINAESTRYGAGVAAAKAAYVADNPTYGEIVSYTNNMNVDSLHLNAKGELQLGYGSFAKALGVTATSAP